MKHTNCIVRIPKGLYPCRIEGKLTQKQVGGKWILVREMTMISKDGEISKFSGYHSSEEEVEENEGLKEVWEKMEYVISDSDSDLESTASSCVKSRKCRTDEQLQNIIPQIVTQVTANVTMEWSEMEMVGTMDVPTRLSLLVTLRKSKNDFKALLVEEFYPSNKMEKLESEFWNHTMVGANHVVYTDRFHELAKLVPHLVTPKSLRIKRILTDEAVRYGTLTKGNDKRKEM
ncbi:hypothetical protein Tco_0997998 [Tanacetum coccineum]